MPLLLVQGAGCQRSKWWLAVSTVYGLGVYRMKMLVRVLVEDVGCGEVGPTERYLWSRPLSTFFSSIVVSFVGNAPYVDGAFEFRILQRQCLAPS